MILKLASLIGPERRWVLVADRGFGCTELFRTLDEAGVPYIIRVSGTAWMEHKSFSGQVWNLPRRVGCSRTYREVLYHKTKRWPVTLVVTHQEPAPEPW